MSRHYAVDSTFTTTGAAADHRLRMKPSRIGAFAAALAQRMGVAAVAASPVAFTEREMLHLDAMAEDLRRAGSRGVVLAGESQPAAVHAFAMSLNAAIGSTVVTMLDPGEEPQPPQGAALAELVAGMRAGQVPNLLILGVNPVYDAPAELNFAEALRGVRNSIHVGFHRDETAGLCAWHLPRAHYLESWGDGRSYDGTLSVIQPLIAPLNEKIEGAGTGLGTGNEAAWTSNAAAGERNDIHSDIEILNLLANGTDVSGYDLVRETWRGQIPGDFEQGWRRVLHDGFLPNTAFSATRPVAMPAGVLPAPLPEGQLELVFRLDSKLLDGTFANNAWMQELPDMMTKITWDNVALVSRATADRLGLKLGYDAGKHYADVIELNVEGRTQRIPAWVLPGQADDTITVSLGYGRELATARNMPAGSFWDIFSTDDYSDVYSDGPIANGVGSNVGPLRNASFSSIAPVTVQKVDTGYLIATTQEHGEGSHMHERPIILEATLDEFRANPAFVREQQPQVPGGSIWEETPALWEDRHPKYDEFYKHNLYYKNQWGMVIDLSSCTGCSACVIACQAENNVQVVGKNEVSRGHEMHWLRMDRYFIGDDEHDPRAAFQWMACQHCENAPCEPVCPVVATYHSPDGTNQMVYNRCIGTRYCSNNCPYKIRRFNWFNWAKTLPVEVQMQQNPRVTTRFRGVMEKCTFCIQRVRAVQRDANLESRPIRDNEVQTACQQACAAQAITFGDLNDPTSDVTRARQNPRRYELLAELGTKPRVSYLGRVRNPHPQLEPVTPNTTPESHPSYERDDEGNRGNRPGTYTPSN